jgi:hypothetical protein
MTFIVKYFINNRTRIASVPVSVGKNWPDFCALDGINCLLLVHGGRCGEGTFSVLSPIL